MSRYHPHRDVTKIYEVADQWKQTCLEGDGSLLGEEQLWTAGNIQRVTEAFVNQPIEGGEQSFWGKLKIQMAGTAEACKLMAEFIYVLQLFQSNILPETKRQKIREVWSWSGSIPPETQYLSNDDYLTGIGNPGQGYNAHKWRELAYFIGLAAAFKALSPEERHEASTDPWAFAEWIDQQTHEGYRQLRPILLHLCFPDTFERISVIDAKRKILSAFDDDRHDIQRCVGIRIRQRVTHTSGASNQRARTLEL